MRANWRRIRRLVIHNVLHTDDTPHGIAAGCALGILVGLTPLIGAHMVIALALATLLRANKVLAVAFVWVTNPLTLGPIYWACWRVGSSLMNGNGIRNGEMAIEHVHNLYAGANPANLTGALETGFWHAWLAKFIAVGTELWLGCLVVGFLASGVAYLVIRRLVIAARRRRQAAKRHARPIAPRPSGEHIAA